MEVDAVRDVVFMLVCVGLYKFVISSKGGG